MTGGPIEPWSTASPAWRDAAREALTGEAGGYLALAATLSPAEALRTCHAWLVGVGLDPEAAAALVVVGAVGRWLVGVSLFATRAVEW